MSNQYKLLTSIAIFGLSVSLFIVVWTMTIHKPQSISIDPKYELTSVQVSLQSYCELEAKHNELRCMTWAENVVYRQFQAAENCYRAFDWFADAGRYTNCLEAEGITLAK